LESSPGGEDDPYIIVTVTSVTPGSNQDDKTVMRGPLDDVGANSIILINEPIVELMTFSGASLNIHVSLCDQEGGEETN
jgi:hypothetical protein